MGRWVLLVVVVDESVRELGRVIVLCLEEIALRGLENVCWGIRYGEFEILELEETILAVLVLALLPSVQHIVLLADLRERRLEGISLHLHLLQNLHHLVIWVIL